MFNNFLVIQFFKRPATYNLAESTKLEQHVAMEWSTHTALLYNEILSYKIKKTVPGGGRDGA